MTLIQKLDNEVKDFRTKRALEMVYKSTCKDVGDFGGLGGLIDHCLKNGFEAEAVLLNKVFELNN